MNRYKNITVKANELGKQVYRTCIYPSIPSTLDDIYIITQVGDRLDLLATTYYNNPEYWIVIAAINNIGKGSMIVPAGLQLRIIKDPETFINAIV